MGYFTSTHLKLRPMFSNAKCSDEGCTENAKNMLIVDMEKIIPLCDIHLTKLVCSIEAALKDPEDDS